LATGTFVVRNGQRVEQGQALALAGNSGYTLGEGGGYHVHVSVTRALPISSQSIPFMLEDLPGPLRGSGINRTVVSSNASPLCDCRSEHLSTTALAVSRSAPRQFLGETSVAQWWSDVIAVPRGLKVLDVTLSWDGPGNDLDLHLMSPSGKHYGWYGDTTGYSGRDSNPERFRIPKPEPGTWRVSVQGISGSGPLQFGVDTSAQKPATRLASTGQNRAALRP